MLELKWYFDRELPGINDFLTREARQLDGLVRDVALHILDSGGKRIRPMLTLLFARAFGYDKDDHHAMACALELLHSATLLHDDYLDSAELRRGKTAAHLVFGTTETILAGDALLALANEMGARYGNPRLTKLLADGIMATARGEILEIEHGRNPNFDLDPYMEIIDGKTARLIETACRCGAALAGADRDREDAAGEYGLNLGLAFQLVDDALDYASPSKDTGKPEGGDVREGKITLPLIFYMEGQDESRKADILMKFRDKSMTPDECNDLVNAVKAEGHADRTRKAAADYVEKALRCLDVLPKGKEKKVLKQAAEFVLKRSK